VSDPKRPEPEQVPVADVARAIQNFLAAIGVRDPAEDNPLGRDDRPG
jgi:hypothetical protein